MRLTTIFATITCASQAVATPSVLTDLAPIHGLVSAVMGDFGTPTLLLPPRADPHSYALRPSDARTLSNAELIIWVGHDLTPWLADPIATLAKDAISLELFKTAGWDRRELHDDHSDDDDNHGHGNFDPHAWIDPAVAAVWVGYIADQLADVDPANAENYQTNAESCTAELMRLRTTLKAQLALASGQPIIWPHNAYGYFVDAFDLLSVATIADAASAVAANSPGPAHIAQLRSLPDVTCVLLTQR